MDPASPKSPKIDNDHEDHASDDESFSGSESSTIVYSHEPYETYQFRVRKLLDTLYGSEAAQTAELTRLKGGSYNRITSVVIAPNDAEPTTQEELILRLPRFKSDANITRQVRLLRGLKPFLPVPEVVRHDTSETNALDSPYVLMHRMPGQSLENVIQDMNFEDRRDMARQIAQLLAKIHRIPVPSSIGPLSVDETGALSVEPLLQGPSFRGNKKTDEEEQILDPLSATLREFVSSRLAGHRARSLRQKHISYFAIKESDRLLDASDILLSALPESDSDHCLALFHRDFAPRNILVAQSMVPGESNWAVTGVLDWDDCEAAPLAIARVRPGWLWAAADEDEDEDESYFDLNEWDPDLSVPNEECERIKSVFVEEIEKLEPGYLDMVRTTRDYYLRPIYERSRGGFWSTAFIKDVDRVVKVAKQLSPEATIHLYGHSLLTVEP